MEFELGEPIAVGQKAEEQEFEIGEPQAVLELAPSHQQTSSVPEFKLPMAKSHTAQPEWSTNQGIDNSKPWTTDQGKEEYDIGDAIATGISTLPDRGKKTFYGLGVIASAIAGEPTAFANSKAQFEAADKEIKNKMKPIEDSFMLSNVAGASSNIAMQAPLILGAIAAGTSIPTLIAMGFSAGVDKTAEYLAAGKDLKTSLAAGSIVGTSEALTEKLQLKYLTQAGMPFFKRLIKSTIYGDAIGESANTVVENATDWAFKNPEATVGEFFKKLGQDELNTMAQVMLTAPFLAGIAHPAVKLAERGQTRMLERAAQVAGLNEEQAKDVVVSTLGEAKGKTEAELAKDIEKVFNEKLKEKIGKGVQEAQATDVVSDDMQTEEMLGDIEKQAQAAKEKEELEAAQKAEQEKKETDVTQKATTTETEQEQKATEKEQIESPLSKRQLLVLKNNKQEVGAFDPLIKKWTVTDPENGSSYYVGKGESVTEKLKEHRKSWEGKSTENVINIKRKQSEDKQTSKKEDIVDRDESSVEQVLSDHGITPDETYVDRMNEEFSGDNLYYHPYMSTIRKLDEAHVADEEYANLIPGLKQMKGKNWRDQVISHVFDKDLSWVEENRDKLASRYNQEKVNSDQNLNQEAEQATTRESIYKTKREALIEARKIGGIVEGTKGNWKVIKPETTEEKVDEELEGTIEDHSEELTIEQHPLFSEAEQGAMDSLHGQVDYLRNQATLAYKNNDQVLAADSAAKADKFIEAVEEAPGKFARNFADILKYNQWRDKLYRVAGYAADVLKAINNKLGEGGFVMMPRGLANKLNSWKEARTFHKQKEIRQRIEGHSLGGEVKITDNIPDDMWSAWQWFMGPKLILVKKFPAEARKLIGQIYNADKLWHHETLNEKEFIDREEKKFSEAEKIELTKMGKAISEFSQKARASLSKNTDLKPSEIKQLMDQKTDEFFKGYEASDKIKEEYKYLREEFFDKFQGAYKQYLYKSLRFHTKENFLKAMDDIFVKQIPHGTALAQNNITSARDLAKFGATVKDYIKQVNDIKTWGLEDYWTHFMRGSIVVMHGDKIVTVALDTKTALDRAQDYIEENREALIEESRKTGKPVELKVDNKFLYDDLPELIGRKRYQVLKGRFDKLLKETDEKEIKSGKLLAKVVGVRPAQVFAGPTQETKFVLPGEDNIFDAMRAYSRVMWKKMSYDPVIWELRKKLDSFPQNVREHLEETLKASMGQYSRGDQILDELADRLGSEKGMLWSRVVGATRSSVVKMKLGYRPMAAVANGLDAIGRIWLENSAATMVEAAKLLRTAEGKALMDKYAWSLGARALEEPGGSVTTGLRFLGHTLRGKAALFAPLGLFNEVELPARRLNWMTAYVSYKDMKLAEQPGYDKGLLEEEAVEFAIDSVDRLQGANILASMPRIMRSPTGRLFTLFKPFLSRTVEMIAYNSRSPMFWSKFLTYTATIAGPRGLWAMMKGLPIATAIGAIAGIDFAWDKVDEWLMRKIPRVAGGIWSLLGVDAVAPTVVQMPQSLADWFGGAVVSSVVTAWKTVGEAIGNPNWWAVTKEGVEREIPVVRNFWDIADSVIDKDGWVRDSDGEPRYNLYGAWERGIVAFGARPQIRSEQDALNRLIKEIDALKNEKSRNIISYFKTEVSRINNIDMFRPEGIPEKIMSKIRDDLIRYKIQLGDLSKAASDTQMPPVVRELLEASVLSKTEFWDEIQEADKKYSNGILMPQFRK
jgi:hypothetical protein